MTFGLRYTTLSAGVKHASFLTRQSSLRRFSVPISAVLPNSKVVRIYTNSSICHYSITQPSREEETKLHKKGREDTRYAINVASDTVHNVEEFVVDTAKSAYQSGKEYSKVIKEELKKEYDPNDKEYVHRATDAVTDAAKDVYSATREVAKKAGDAIYDKATDLAAAGTYKVIQGASTLANAGKEYAAGAVEAVRESLPDTEEIKETAKDLASSASEKIAHGMNVAAQSGTEVAKSAFESGKEFVVSASEVVAKTASETVAAAQEYANKKIVDDEKPSSKEKKGN